MHRKHFSPFKSKSVLGSQHTPEKRTTRDSLGHDVQSKNINNKCDTNSYHIEVSAHLTALDRFIGPLEVQYSNKISRRQTIIKKKTLRYIVSLVKAKNRTEDVGSSYEVCELSPATVSPKQTHEEAAQQIIEVYIHVCTPRLSIH